MVFAVNLQDFSLIQSRTLLSSDVQSTWRGGCGIKI